MLGERDDKAIVSFLTTLHETDAKKNPYRHIMPPLIGEPDEIHALAQYLHTISHPDTSVKLAKH